MTLCRHSSCLYPLRVSCSAFSTNNRTHVPGTISYRANRDKNSHQCRLYAPETDPMGVAHFTPLLAPSRGRTSLSRVVTGRWNRANKRRYFLFSSVDLNLYRTVHGRLPLLRHSEQQSLEVVLIKRRQGALALKLQYILCSTRQNP